MIRIGLFLNAARSSGGTYQYCQTVLDAMAGLPKDRFSAVAAYADHSWRDAVERVGIHGIAVRPSLVESVIGRAWEFLSLPSGFWRTHLGPHLPTARKLATAKASLWVFPAQDRWSYRLALPSACAVHDLMHRYERRFPEVGSTREYWDRESRYRRIAESAAAILVDSEVGRQQVHESYGYPLDRIFVLPYAPPRYLTDAARDPSFSGRYRLPDKFIFYPAQFWRHKNHENLIRAVALLVQRLPDLHLVLAGSPKNGYAASMDVVAQLGIGTRVHAIGYVSDSDMPELYRRARALVMPTYFGPTNIPPLEAFTVGCPVAVSRIYGMPKQVGTAALLFNPDSPEQIADCIERLWTDQALCDRLVSAGHERANYFSHARFAERFRELVETICTNLDGTDQ
jgi:glycosyltransferase involved in cell wall biosynthesis